jgi:hypothetical protein
VDCLFLVTHPQKTEESPPADALLLTGGLRLELLPDIGPVGLAHAGRPEVGAGCQDGGQVVSRGVLLGRRALLAGCWIAL